MSKQSPNGMQFDSQLDSFDEAHSQVESCNLNAARSVGQFLLLNARYEISKSAGIRTEHHR
jgi:hypothetical protein